MNPKHLSKSDGWQTPTEIVERVRKVLGQIALDPASSTKANETVRANRIITREEDALSKNWDCMGQTIFLNPPGGKSGNRSMVDLFWQRLLSYRWLFMDAVFLCFSIEALQVMQTPRFGDDLEPLELFPICIPQKRIRFGREDGNSASSPTHANAIIYVPGTANRAHSFVDGFEDLGIILNRGDY